MTTGPDTTERILGGAFSLLGQPPGQDNLLGDACEALLGALEQFGNLVSVYDAERLIARGTFTTLEGKDEVFLADDVATLRRVETDDPAMTRRIQIPLLADIEDLATWQPEAAGLADGGDQSADLPVWPRQAAWYQDGEKIVLRFASVPPGGVRCRYFYTPTGTATLDLEQPTGFLRNYTGLLKAEVALRLLPRLGMTETDYRRYGVEIRRQRDESLDLLNRWLMQQSDETAGVVAGYGDGWARR